MNENENKERADFYKDNSTEVHVKTNQAFYNGKILDVTNNKIILDDRFFGLIPLFFTEIISIEPYMQKGEKRE